MLLYQLLVKFYALGLRVTEALTCYFVVLSCCWFCYDVHNIRYAVISASCVSVSTQYQLNNNETGCYSMELNIKKVEQILSAVMRIALQTCGSADRQN